MEKIIVFCAAFVCIFLTYSRRKEFLVLFPSIFIIHKVAIQFSSGPVLDFIGRIVSIGAVAWIAASFYVCALYSVEHYLKNRPQNRNITK